MDVSFGFWKSETQKRHQNALFSDFSFEFRLMFVRTDLDRIISFEFRLIFVRTNWDKIISFDRRSNAHEKSTVSTLRSFRILAITFHSGVGLRRFYSQIEGLSKRYKVLNKSKTQFGHLDGQKCLRSGLVCAGNYFLLERHQMTLCKHV